MAVAMLMLSLVAAIIGGVVAWTAMGFWWGLLAYAVTGAATLLLLGILITMQPLREARKPSRKSRQPSCLAKPKATG